MNTEQFDEAENADIWDEQDDFKRPQRYWWERLGGLLRPWRAQEKNDQEWMGYYKKTYKSHGPSVKLFTSLLARNGFYNLNNPFVDGNPHFYDFCQDGITLADIDFVLGRWEEKFAPKTHAAPSARSFVADGRKDSEIKTQDLIAQIAGDWPILYSHHPQQLQGQSISMTEDNNRKSWIKKQKRWEADAIKCLVVLFKSAVKNWIWISEIVHQDNIRLLCKIVYDNAPQSDRSILLKQWKKAGWVTEASQKWFK